jgi:hypothetical protein
MAGFAPNVQSGAISAFLALPVEIRQQICEYALAPNRHICFCRLIDREVAPAVPASSNQAHATYHEKPAVNLLATCLQVYEEVKHIVFGMNTMIIPFDVTFGVNQKPDTFDKTSQAFRRIQSITTGAPKNVLEKATKVALVVRIEYAGRLGQVVCLPEALRSLQSLSMTILTRREPRACQSLGNYTTGAKFFLYRQVLKDVLDRAPRNCKVSLHPSTEAEVSSIAMIKTAGWSNKIYQGDEWVQVVPQVLGLCVKDILLARSKLEIEDK